MQNLIDKLLKFKEKIDKATLYNNEFKEFIGIEVFEFIKKNEILNSEFERRFKYLQNLSEDKDFIKLQDDIFDAVVEITKLTDIDAIKKAQEKYQALGGFYNGNRLKISKKEFSNLTTLTELYEAIQDKNVYYRLGEKSYCEMGEISIFCHIMPLRNQYDFIGGIFRYIYAALQDNNKKEQIEKCEILTQKYDDLLFQLDEKIYKIPKLLHTKQFEDFFIFCAETYPQKGSEFWYNANKYNFLSHDEKRLKQIKEFTFVVIDDLIEAVGAQEQTPVQPIQKKIKIKNITLNEKNLILEINGGEKIISFKSRKNKGENEETKFFKIVYHLWEFREEVDKNKKIIKEGDWTTLSNLAKGAESTEAATSRNISRLKDKFLKEGVPIEIRASNNGRYRLVIQYN